MAAKPNGRLVSEAARRARVGAAAVSAAARGRDLETEISQFKDQVARAEADLHDRDAGISRRDEQLADLRDRLQKRNANLKKLRSRAEAAESGGFRSQRGRRWNSREEVPVFFLVGAAKSGTGWLMSLLDAHPEILCRGEGRIFGRNTSRLDPEGVEDERERTGGRIPPTSLQYALYNDEYLRLWVERSPWTRGKDTEEHLAGLTRLATNYFLTEWLAAAPRLSKRMIGDKTPLQSTETGDDMEILREIFNVYPDSKVIHIVRDGRDRAVSRMHHVWRSARDRGGVHDLERESIRKREAYHEDRERFGSSGESIFTEDQLRGLAADWRERVGRAGEDGPNLLGEGYAEVRYEDLLADPAGEAARLFGFLGAADDAETAARCVEATSFEKLSGRKPGEEPEGLDFKKRRKGIAGDWKNVFTERDKEIFKEEAGDLLIRLGYEQDRDW